MKDGLPCHAHIAKAKLSPRIFERLDVEKKGELSLDDLMAGARKDPEFQSRLRVMATCPNSSGTTVLAQTCPASASNDMVNAASLREGGVKNACVCV